MSIFVQNGIELSKEVEGKIPRRLSGGGERKNCIHNNRLFVQNSPKLTKGYRGEKFILNFLFSGDSKQLCSSLIARGKQ